MNRRTEPVPARAVRRRAAGVAPGVNPLRTSVVMITHNRQHLLERHLPILLADPAATEVIVVNDGSDDGTAAFLADMANHHPQLIAINIENGGMDNARRTGVDRATGDLLVLMDDDVQPTESMITRHVGHHSQGENLVVVGYMPVIDSALTDGNLATAAYAVDYERVMSRYERDPRRILLELWNGHVSMRRDAYLRARDGDDTWPRQAFFEDRHLGLQLHRLGLVGRFDRNLKAYHRHAGDLKSFRRNARSMGYGGRLLHERHPDLLGPYDPTEWVDDLAVPLRWIVRLGELPGAEALTAMLERIARLADRAGGNRSADRVARLMRRMELRIGARHRSRDARKGSHHGC
jgi:glycosyltransferase involved in cell wall biosynthesis